MDLYPLLLRPIYMEKPWGGRALQGLGRTLPGGADTRVGESWEVADLASTSPSGAGGAAVRSAVENGPLAGWTLTELVERHGDALLGGLPTSSAGGFPLLVKYLDAHENLSVQVHPSPEYAARHPGAHVKSEAWYVVHAEPGAAIYRGVRPGTSRAAFERALRDGEVDELLVRVPARPGSCHVLPSGTCHALGRGILVAEVQTPSDTTFRLYDWGRRGRELHVEAALEAMSFAPDDGSPPEAPAVREPSGGTTRALMRCAHFGIDEWRGDAGHERHVALGRPEVWMVIEGSLDIASGADGVVTVPGGRTVVLPASLGRVEARMTETVLMLRVTLGGGSAEV